MKKRIISVLAAAAVIIACAGCVTKNDEKKETTTTTAASATTTTTAADVTGTPAAATTSAAPQETDPNKTALLTLPGGKIIYSEDGTMMSEWEGGFIKSYNTGYVRISTGFYHDSVSDPDLFNTEDFIYSGDKPALGEIREVKAGDTIGGLTVKSTELNVGSYSADNCFIFGNFVTFDGEVTLTGIMSYYYDEQYGIMSGDILFTPDSCYAGLPLACNPISETVSAYPRFDVIEDYTGDGTGDKKIGNGPAFISDAPTFRAGNLFENYAGNGELNDVTNGGNTNVTRKVQVTLSDIKLEFSDQFGTNHCSAVIKSIKAL